MHMSHKYIRRKIIIISQISRDTISHLRRFHSDMDQFPTETGRP